MLVNNAAYQQSQEHVEDISFEQFDRTFRTKIYGYFFMTQATLRRMQPGGRIVNCGSITGLQGHKTLVDYAATNC